MIVYASPMHNPSQDAQSPADSPIARVLPAVANAAEEASEGSAPPAPLGDRLIDLWSLDPAVTFLNHGSFGARPRAVQDAQQRWRQEFERSPVEMFDRRRDELLAPVIRTVANFIGANADDVGLVTNTTEGINGILRSLHLKPDDELLTTDHVYHAVRQTMRYVTRRADAVCREVEIPLPITSAATVTQRIMEAVNERTRLVVLDHVTSPTAAVFPVESIVAACAQRGVDVCIDGAHAPGMLPLHIESLGAAYYVGNLHKWVCAPSGAAFLWARSDRQDDLHPAVISHFLDEGLLREFGWQGTRDITSWLAAADAIEWFETQFGWERVRAHNHQLAVWVQRLLQHRWGTDAATPVGGSMLGSMTAIALPNEVRRHVEAAPDLTRLLYERFGIEVPVNDRQGRWWIRPSCHIYNTPDQYERLADAIEALT